MAKHHGAPGPDSTRWEGGHGVNWGPADGEQGGAAELDSVSPQPGPELTSAIQRRVQ